MEHCINIDNINVNENANINSNANININNSKYRLHHRRVDFVKKDHKSCARDHDLREGSFNEQHSIESFCNFIHFSYKTGKGNLAARYRGYRVIIGYCDTVVE